MQVMKSYIALLALATIVAYTTALAQTTNPAGAAPETPKINTGHPAGLHPNDADKLFTKQISLGGMAEVDLAKIASRRAADPGVKNFAHRMVSDHDQANARLGKVAKAAGVPLRTDWDTDHAVMRTQLEKKSAGDFDVAYIRAQITEHANTAQLLEWEIGSGEDPTIRQYAIDMLPTVLDHLQSAQGLLTQLTGAPPRL
jgi:putative membrane protein